MPRNIFDDDEPLFDYGAIDELAAMGIGDRGYVNINPPIGSNELFDDQFERRATELNRTPYVGAQPTHLVPQRRGPWSGNNTLGNEILFAPTANNEQTVLKLDEWDFPEVWSVMLSYSGGRGVNSDGTEVTFQFSIVARLIIGVGGTTHEAEVDWHDGASFSLVMNALNIIALYGINDGEVNPTNLRLKATICKGKITESLPTRTFFFDTATDTIFIPAFARKLRVLSSPTSATFLAATEYTITTQDGNSIVLDGTDLAALVADGSAMTLPGGAISIFFENSTPANVTAYFIFELSF